MSASVGDLAARIDRGLRAVMVGSEAAAFGLQVALLGRGHVLIEGVPGTGKTLLVRTLALLLGLQFRRIQFTPDLMPADVVGTTVFNPKTADFSIRSGPVVANVVLADEINRTPPKTQSALLEAMEEGRVTIDGTPIALPSPFLLCATQNPIEYEGTYPLPEAQLDRFLVKVSTAYPKAEQELALLSRAAAGFDAQSLETSGIVPVTDAEEILGAQQAVRRVHVSVPMQRYLYDIVAATRLSQALALGASPRAALGLLVASQAAAAIAGRDFTTPDDVKDVASFALAHRVIVHAHAEIEGTTAVDVVNGILAAVAVPREATLAP
ncbi:MAG: MoxR family ATPase [Vulcanimicrobiaceae bacterium]